MATYIFKKISDEHLIHMKNICHLFNMQLALKCSDKPRLHACVSAHHSSSKTYCYFYTVVMQFYQWKQIFI